MRRAEGDLRMSNAKTRRWNALQTNVSEKLGERGSKG